MPKGEEYGSVEKREGRGGKGREGEGRGGKGREGGGEGERERGREGGGVISSAQYNSAHTHTHGVELCVSREE